MSAASVVIGCICAVAGFFFGVLLADATREDRAPVTKAAQTRRKGSK